MRGVYRCAFNHPVRSSRYLSKLRCLTRHLLMEGALAASSGDIAREEPIVVSATSAASPHVMGLRISRGRWIADHEQAAGINERLERREFPGEDPCQGMAMKRSYLSACAI